MFWVGSLCFEFCFFLRLLGEVAGLLNIFFKSIGFFRGCGVGFMVWLVEFVFKWLEKDSSNQCFLVYFRTKSDLC